MAFEPGIEASATARGASTSVPSVLELLPVDKVFPIQIGSEVFKISYIQKGCQTNLVAMRSTLTHRAISHTSLWSTAGINSKPCTLIVIRPSSRTLFDTCKDI